MRYARWLMGVLLVLAACESRIPSRSRLEKECGIRLPDDFNVLKDEYREVGTGYCVVYDLKFKSAADVAFFAQKITASSHFRRGGVPGGSERIWFNTDQGYAFRHNNGHTDFTIDFDTASGKVSYAECD